VHRRRQNFDVFYGAEARALTCGGGGQLMFRQFRDIQS
jgi:hypothetical protein